MPGSGELQPFSKRSQEGTWPQAVQPGTREGSRGAAWKQTWPVVDTPPLNSPQLEVNGRESAEVFGQPDSSARLQSPQRQGLLPFLSTSAAQPPGASSAPHTEHGQGGHTAHERPLQEILSCGAPQK